MNKKLLIYLGLIIYSGIVFPQTSNNNCYKDPSDTLFSPALSGTYHINKFAKYKMQYIDLWREGEVLLVSGEIAKNKYLRYNALLDEIMWMRISDYKVVMLYKDLVQGFTIYSEQGKNEKVYKKTIVPDFNYLGSIFLEVLVEGKCSLYCYRRIEMIPTIYELYPDFQYYLKMDEDYIHISLRRSSVLKAFSDEEKTKIKSIIRSNRLKIKKNETDLIRLIVLLNQQNL